MRSTLSATYIHHGVADKVTRLTLLPGTPDSHQRLPDPPTAPDLSLLHVGCYTHRTCLPYRHLTATSSGMGSEWVRNASEVLRIRKTTTTA